MSGFTNDVMNAENVNFSGIDPTEGEITSNGQLMIGSAASPNIRPGFLTSTDGSITVTNGAGTIDISGTASGFQPNAVVQEFDDFLSWNPGVATSKLSWQSSGNWDSENGTTSNPGIVSCEAGGGSAIRLYLLNNNLIVADSTGCVVPGAGLLTVSWITRMDTLSGGGNTYRFSIGLADQDTLDGNSDAYVDAAYFHYTDTVNGGNWQIKCTNTSTTTTVNTSVAATTDFATFTVSINADASLVSFYINNVLVGSTISTNIPTTGLVPFLNVIRTAGIIPSLKADLFWIVLQLSNPRPGPLAGVIPANLRSIENYTQTAISYQVLGTDAIVGVTDTSAARTMTMPIVGTQAGQIWTIKDESGAASVNNITIDGNGYNIDGAATYPISTDYGSVEIYFSGSAFFIR